MLQKCCLSCDLDLLDCIDFFIDLNFILCMFSETEVPVLHRKTHSSNEQMPSEIELSQSSVNAKCTSILFTALSPGPCGPGTS